MASIDTAYDASPSAPAAAATKMAADDRTVKASVNINETSRIWTQLTDAPEAIMNDSILTLKLNEMYFAPKSAKTYTHAQLNAYRHAYSSPNSSGQSFVIQIGTAPNAMTNGRLIVAQIPPIYEREDIVLMSTHELTQFPHTFHVLRGANTFFQTTWQNPLPYIVPFDENSHNGHIAVAWAEINSDSETESQAAASIVVWVNTQKQQYSIPIAPRPFEPISLRKVPRAQRISLDQRMKREIEKITNTFMDLTIEPDRESMLYYLDKLYQMQ